MYGKGKGSSVPSDAQAREKLALYVYEYLLHVGAQKAAQTFLSEIRWEKNITLGEPPGFLHSWWCVFWDLYCAAPERRDTCEHSSEAKAFHDYGFVNSGFGVNGIAHGPGPSPSPMGQTDGMGPLPPGFFPNSTMRPSPPTQAPQGGQQGPPPQMMGGAPFMGPRYPPGGPRGRMPLGSDFNPPGMGPMDGVRGGPPPPGMGGPGGPRGMNPPRPGMGPLGYPPGMRMPGMGMRPQQWGPNGPMNYNSSSPAGYGGGPPGTPIMQSPQDGPGGPGGPGDSGMYGMMKGGPGGMHNDFPMGGPDQGGPLGPGPNDEMKHSPRDGPGTPRDEPDYQLGGFPPENEQAESAAILKIKESMQEEAKRFEKDSEHPDYFMQ